MANQPKPLPQLTREEMTPPVIQPVPPGIRRPRWSVMIPTYNCARFLRETLESVLAQDIDPVEMQIEVIDDCSTSDDPETVVREFGQGRVTFCRQPKNMGAVANFNTCVRRSTGSLVHILHGDDLILPGFYREMERLDVISADSGLLATRNFFCNEEGVLIHLTPCYESVSYSPCEMRHLMSSGNSFQFAGVVVKRSTFERLGGFIPVLVHTADWEMWTRISSVYSISVSNKVLGIYRVFSGSDSSRLVKTAENLRDCIRFEQVVSSQGNAIDLSRLSGHITYLALSQARHLASQGMTEAAAASYQVWRERVKPLDRLVLSFKSGAKLAVKRAAKLLG